MLRRTIDYAGQGERGESPRRELSLKIVWKTACKNGRVGGEGGGGIKQGGKPIKLLRGNGEKGECSSVEEVGIMRVSC